MFFYFSLPGQGWTFADSTPEQCDLRRIIQGQLPFPLPEELSLKFILNGREIFHFREVSQFDYIEVIPFYPNLIDWDRVVTFREYPRHALPELKSFLLERDIRDESNRVISLPHVIKGIMEGSWSPLVEDLSGGFRSLGRFCHDCIYILSSSLIDFYLIQFENTVLIISIDFPRRTSKYFYFKGRGYLEHEIVLKNFSSTVRDDPRLFLRSILDKIESNNRFPSFILPRI